MANWDCPSFEVEVSNEINNFVPLPKRFQRYFNYPVEQRWSLFCGYSNRLFQVDADVRLVERRWRYCIGVGWANFKNAYDIKEGDILRIYVNRRTREFRVRTWRGNHEITGQENNGDEQDDEEEEDVEVVQISDDSDGADNVEEYDTSDDDSDRSFVTRLKKSYMDMNRMNVTLRFAKKYLDGFNEVTQCKLRLRQRVWHAELHIRYGTNNKITNCNIKHGVDEFIRDTNIQPNQKLRLEYNENDDPISFTIQFIDG